jgi:hypothetical protein
MSFSDILGSGMTPGGGLAGALAQGTQGIMQGIDKRREQGWQDEQRNQLRNTWNRSNQEQTLNDTVTPGANDEERIQNLISVAEGMGRGDLSSSLQGKKKALEEQRITDATTMGARAVLVGQFDQAVQHLNKAGMWGQISSIRPKIDPDTGQTSRDTVIIEHLDPETGQPVPAEIPIGAIAAAASDAKSFVSKVLEHQRTESIASGREAALGQKGTQFDRTLEERKRHAMEMEKTSAYRARLAAAKGPGSAQKLSEFDKKMAVARRIYPTEAEAFESVQNPTKSNQVANRQSKVALQVANGYFPAEAYPEAIDKLGDAFTPPSGPVSPMAPAPVPTPPVQPAPTSAPTHPARKLMLNKTTGKQQWVKLVGNKYVWE